MNLEKNFVSKNVRTCYYFDDIFKLEDFDRYNIMLFTTELDIL